ncbi:M20 aminoacylase family protein [Bradyrhizobium zhanjiangense]|uniref:Amidohydrolase n=1 Tax=Bradyrhizobium zhanjiangense TaxID=1325107 RepID=A0ABY0D9F0_9BRAD|nr:M20 aminoacylase family protein [Bradyrhizobium zhanjiangense]RXG84479.1 amidohydrolase [Bradyrhizobium zhanjiangense]
MPIVNCIPELLREIRTWRHEIHAHPELAYNEHRTAAFVAERLHEFGCDEIVTGLAKTGVVGVIRGTRAESSGNTKVIGLRAELDALPIEEATNLPYVSRTKGVMHACGHDGHTAMLLGTSRYLAETRNFAGTVVVIFQPAEEHGYGAVAMIKDGLMERFGIEEVYGMHNWPGAPVGTFAIRRGPAWAAVDSFDIKIEGRGGHAMEPHKCIDSVLIGALLITALQQIVARNVDPLEPAAISIGKFHVGEFSSVIAQTSELRGNIRAVTPEVRKLMRRRLREVVAGTAQMTGAKIELNFVGACPTVINSAAQTQHAINAAREIVGESNVDEMMPPIMSGDDFADMLEARPGAYILCGNGDSAGLHHPAYEFNDAAMQYGVSYWIKVAENALSG